MKLTILVLNLFFTNLCFAQSDYPYSRYVDLVMLAEDAYVLESYCEANEIYKRIIEEVETPFHEEMTKALDSAKKCGDEDQLLSIAIKLAKGGIPKNYFHQFNYTYWYDFFVGDFDAFTQYYKDNYNLVLKEQINSLIVEDSIYNSEFHEFREGAKYVSLDKQITGAESILSKFETITKEHGFPCEKRIGYQLRDGQLKDYDLWSLLLHIYQRGEILYFNEEYTEKIGAGDMHFLDEIFLDKNSGASGIPDYGLVNEIVYLFKKYLRT